MRARWIIVIVIVLAFVYLVFDTLFVAGSFKTIENLSAGEIESIYTGIYGPEDMEVDEATARLFISSCDRRRILEGPRADDGIWVLDIDSGAAPRKIPSTYSEEFHAHGISLLRRDSTLYLFAVNHNSFGDHIETFLVRHDTLVHLRTYNDKDLCCPNDVAAVAPEKFYVTNDHGNPWGLMRTIEEYGRLPLSSIKYYNGSGFSTVCDGLQYGNGINVNADGTRVFVATTIGRHLLTYDRNRETGELKHLASLSLDTGLDNIDVDADGNLWIAAHPKLLAFVGHAKDASRLSPSQVIRLRPTTGNEYEVADILVDDGTLLSGSSVAVRYKDWLFVGCVFQPRILRIRLSTHSLLK